MKNEFKQALEDMQKLILDLKEKYHIEQDDFVKFALQMNKFARLALTGTFEGDGKMKTHKIKLLLNFCDDVLSGDKTFEIRENDRGYQKGDRVVFEPYSPSDPFVKHPISDKVYEITYVLSGWGLKNGYVVFGIKEVEYEF